MENLPIRSIPHIECKSFQLITNPVNNYVLKSDTAGVGTWSTGGNSGTVTSITAGTGLTGGTITTTGTIDLANTTVTPASYTNANITVDAQGRITSAANGTVNPGTITSITAGTGLTGGTITSSGTIDLANTTVTPASYTNANITVDAQGRITSAANGSSGGNSYYDAYIPADYKTLDEAINAGKQRISITGNCNCFSVMAANSLYINIAPTATLTFKDINCIQYNNNNQDIIIEGYGNIYLEPFVCNLIHGEMRATYFNNINIICSNNVTGFNLSVNSIYLYVNNCNFTGGTMFNILYLGCSYIYINQTEFNFSTAINNIYLTSGRPSGQIDTYFNKITSNNSLEIRLFSSINNLTIKNSKINNLQSPQFSNTINGNVNITNNEFDNLNPNILNGGKPVNISNNTGLSINSSIFLQRYIYNATINNNIGNGISFDSGPDSSDISGNILNNRLWFYGNSNNNTVTSNKIGIEILLYAISGSNSNIILMSNKANTIYAQGGTNILAVGNIASLTGVIHANSTGNIP